MPAGELREMVGFYDRLPVDSQYGIAAGQWEHQFTRSARIRRLKGTEPVIGQRLEGISPCVITLRASDDTRRIDTGWQARNMRTGEEFQIRTVTPDEKRAWIDILCESGVAQ